MASNINSNIDANFPVAGQDNDSQGFRDNFSVIKNSLAAAKVEIEEIQNKAVVKSKFDDDSSINNNFNGNAIVNVELDQATGKFNAVPTLTSNTDIDFENGHYQTVALGANVQLTLVNWPNTERYAKMIVHLTASDGGPWTVSWSVEGGGTIKNDGNGIWSNFVIDSATNPKIVEFWTYDGGTTVFARYLGIFT